MKIDNLRACHPRQIRNLKALAGYYMLYCLIADKLRLFDNRESPVGSPVLLRCEMPNAALKNVLSFTISRLFFTFLSSFFPKKHFIIIVTKLTIKRGQLCKIELFSDSQLETAKLYSADGEMVNKVAQLLLLLLYLLLFYHCYYYYIVLEL